MSGDGERYAPWVLRRASQLRQTVWVFWNGHWDAWEYLRQADPSADRPDAKVVRLVKPLLPAVALGLAVPQMKQMLCRMRATELLDGDERLWVYGIRANTGSEEETAFVSPPPPEQIPDVAPVHKMLMETFGGFLEPPDVVSEALKNVRSALTVEDASQDLVHVHDLLTAFGERIRPLPIDLDDYYPLASGADGSYILANRNDGRLFKASWTSDGRSELARFDGPDGPGTDTVNGLYDLRGFPDIETWLETLATDVLAAVDDGEDTDPAWKQAIGDQLAHEGCALIPAAGCAVIGSGCLVVFGAAFSALGASAIWLARASALRD